MTQIPLGRVAEATVTKSFTSIKRVDRRRALNISADADKGTTDIAALRKELTVFLDDLLADHGHIRWTFEGEARYQRESQGQMLISFLIVIAAMYGMMAIPFKSYSQPLIVLLVALCALPLAAAQTDAPAADATPAPTHRSLRSNGADAPPPMEWPNRPRR